ncbi:MotA/TolQ/ExbB proton channel family protein [Pseudomonadota bacterium]
MPYKSLVLWMLWAVLGITVYAVLYDDAGIAHYIENDASRITWLIAGMFALGVIASFYLCLKITGEAVHLSSLLSLARDGGLSAISANTGKRAVDRFFRALKTTVDTKGEPDLQMLMRSELSAYERSSHSVEVTGNLLVTMGLIGTVMGLTLTLSGLTGSLEALGHDQEELLSGLRQAMGGMSTAFYTTLLGAVLGGILLRVFAQITSHGVEGLYDKLSHICLVYCSADYKDSMQSEVRALNNELRVMDAQLQTLQSTFSNSTRIFNGFRNEVKTFTTGGDQADGVTLGEIIHQHKEYCNTLREEMRLIYALNRPWWLRVATVLLPGGK